MRLHKTVIGLFVCVLLLGLATVTSAGPPPQGDDPLPPRNGGFDPVPIRSGLLAVDRLSGSILYAEMADTAQAEQTAPVVKPDDSAVATFRPGGSKGNTLTRNPASTIQAQDLLIGSSAQSGRPGEDLSIAASTIITLESFESAFPSGTWQLDGTHTWGAVDCNPVEGSRSVWPATNAADPCSGADYPDNTSALLFYGPFSLEDAKSASFDFFYRSDIQNIESCDDPVAGDCDFFYWGASSDGSNFLGMFETGAHVGGPFPNGYNFASLDLDFVVGEPQVWILFAFESNGDSTVSQGPFIDLVSLRKNTDPRETITFQNFDSDVFPNPSWIPFDNDGPANGEYWWDDVDCFSRSGDWSMWPADSGADGLDPCFAGDEYANNMDSWLVHGPLDLTGASEAWVDFFFRNESESSNDRFWWCAFTPGSDCWGFWTSGDLAVGPHNNGYNLMRFDLSDVGALGDLRGESEVWIAFSFESNESITGRGPFVDDVSVVVEVEESQAIHRTFLPALLKNPSPITRLFITNHTGGALTYRVKNTPDGTKSCSVPDNQVKLCATFRSGTYDWEATAHCGSSSGTRTYSAGDDYPKAFECQ